MTDREKILAEVEWLLNSFPKPHGEVLSIDQNAYNLLGDLKLFIESLPVEHQSEDKDLEDSRLLFKTFCDGLMYGMFFYHGENLHRVASIEGLGDTINGVYPIKECKPCLRSIPHLTEEEQFQLGRLLGAASYNILKGNYSYLRELLEYVHKNHIDLFGLIPKGLALEAPKGMYNT